MPGVAFYFETYLAPEVGEVADGLPVAYEDAGADPAAVDWAAAAGLGRQQPPRPGPAVHAGLVRLQAGLPRQPPLRFG